MKNNQDCVKHFNVPCLSLNDLRHELHEIKKESMSILYITKLNKHRVLKLVNNYLTIKQGVKPIAIDIIKQTEVILG